MNNSKGSSPLIYIINGLITCSGVFFIYQILENSNWTFAPNWNMFESILIIPLYIIGLLVMFANWNTFHFSSDTYIKTTYADGSSKTEKSYDITDVIFGRFLLPVLGRFVIVPLLVSAAIYYPIMFLVWIVGSVFPWIISLIIVCIIILAWLLSKNLDKHLIIYVIGGAILSFGFAYGAYYLHQSVTPTNNFTPTNNSTTIDKTGFEDADDF